MKLFGRRNTVNNDLPPEIQAYAKSERRERMGMAWLIGLLSLAVTFVVAAGLFFGGRWIYRSISNDDKPQSTAQKENKPKTEEKSKTNGQTKPNDATSNADHTDTPAQAPVPTPPATTTQPASGDNSETLVRTGPDIDL